MKKTQLENLINDIKKDGYAVYCPVEVGGRVLVRPLENPKKYAFVEKLPYYSYKAFFIAPKEVIFGYDGGKIRENKMDYPKIALLGIRKIDLKAVAFCDEVFQKDAYYQARRKNILIIGHDQEDGAGTGFLEQYDRDKLEDLPFDIFLSQKKNDYKVYAGTASGKKFLQKSKIKDFTEIRYVAPRKNDPETLKLRTFMEKAKFSDKMWQDLGRICIECGQCTISCPTCYCFAVMEDYQLGAQKGERVRVWDSCYYSDFSQITGGHKFLDDTAKKIHFWYTHKFSRDPKHLNMLGCIGCERCTHSCPVDISIKKVLASMVSGGESYENNQKEEYGAEKIKCD